MSWRFYETPHRDTVTCHFSDDQVRVEFLSSLAQLGSRSDDRAPLTGHLLGGVS
jgi:hypothetical protein